MGVPVATLRYDVDVDNRRAEARIGAFATRMRQQITQAVRSLPDIEINADSTPAQREMARLRQELKDLADQRIGVDIDGTEAQRRLAEIRSQLERLSAESGDIQIGADTEAARAALEEINAEVDHLDGRRARVKVDVDKSLSDSIIQVAMLGRALQAIALPASAVGLIPMLGGIAASIGDLTGVAGLLPAALVAGGVAAGTLAAGFAHVSDALGPTGTPAQIKKVNEALAALSPNARAAILAVRDLAPAWTNLRMDVQTRLFAGTTAEVKSLAGIYLPMLRGTMGSVATSFNDGAIRVAEFLKSGSGVAAVQRMFDNTALSAKAISPALVNVVAGLTDVGTVGSTFLPRLSTFTVDLTGRFREFIAQARESGQLQQWIQTGIDKVDQLGRVAANAGGALSAFFSAASASGHDFLDTAERVTAEVEKLLRSAPAQNGITAFFSETGAAAEAALPGLRGFATAFFQAVSAAAATGGLHTAGQALTDVLNAVSPLLPALGQLAGNTLHGLAAEASAVAPVIGGIASALLSVVSGLGPVSPAVLGAVLAFRLLNPIGDVVGRLGVSVAALATRMGASEVAAGRIATVFGRVGSAIPILGAAVIGLGILYDALRDKTDETATAILKGSQDFATAVDEQVASLRAQQDAVTGSTAAIGRVAAGNYAAAQSTRVVKTEAELHKEAVDKLVGAMTAQVNQMSGVEAAQGRVKIAQVLWNDAVSQFSPNSAAAANAAGVLQIATAGLEAEQRRAADASKTLADRITEASQAGSAAANADVAYQQAIINVAQANDNAATVAGRRGVSERDLAQANLQVQQANLQAADAARRKAEADATASGATNVAQIGAQAYKDELIRLANQATGPTRDALLAMANGTDVSARASSTAEINARAQKDELGRLAGMATGPLAGAITTSIKNFDQLGGAHATAEARAASQKAELLRLADMASGPVKASLLAMADQVSHLPNGSFTVTATGVTAYKFTSTGEVLGSGNTGLAAGGVWRPNSGRYMADSGVMPGNTPGRDVHHFFSPTAGGLHLSGGEAVMRPEWTTAIQSMNPRYVRDANMAARRGGVRGVMSFLSSTSPGAAGGQTPKGQGRRFAGGGIIGGQRLALGGWVDAGKQRSAMAPEVFRTDAAEARQVLIREVQARLRAHEAAARAAIARAAAAAAAAAAGIGGAVAGGPVWDVIQRTAAQFGWGGGSQYSALQWIIQHESGGRPNAQNPTSTAYGLFQFLNGTWASTGIGKTSDPSLQSLAGMRYISSRYGSPAAAKAFWQAHGWYGQGGTIPAHLADTGAMLATGHAAVNLSGMPERVLSPSETRAYAAGGDGSGMVVAEVSRLRSDVQDLRAALASAGGDTFNIHADNAREGAQSTRMLLRARR
jgi:hypothetical protein